MKLRIENGSNFPIPPSRRPRSITTLPDIGTRSREPEVPRRYSEHRHVRDARLHRYLRIVWERPIECRSRDVGISDGLTTSAQTSSMQCSGANVTAKYDAAAVQRTWISRQATSSGESAVLGVVYMRTEIVYPERVSVEMGSAEVPDGSTWMP